MSATGLPPPATTGSRVPPHVLLICLACMTLEGYDIIAYGAALPYMLADPEFGMTVARAAAAGSLTPLGMLGGAITVGLLADLVGRRRLILASLALFSLAMTLCALAPNWPTFALGRFLVGLGAGGILPCIAALMFEFSSADRRNRNTAWAFAGAGVGGILSALTAALIVPAAGWRAEFLIGGLGAVLVLPIGLRFLPESVAYLRAAGREQAARRWSDRLGLEFAAATGAPEAAPPVRRGLGQVAALFDRRYALTTVMFFLTAFISLLMLFMMNTWLPQLMRSAGYELGSALTFLLVLQVGGAVGPLLFGPIADRTGSKRAIAASFLLAVVGISVLSYPMPLVLLYGAVILAGVGTQGTQILLNVFIASRYPVQVRATAIGTALSVGRLGAIVGPLYGGVLLTSQLPTAWLFYAVAAPALVGVLLVALVPSPASRPDTTSVAPAARPA